MPSVVCCVRWIFFVKQENKRTIDNETATANETLLMRRLERCCASRKQYLSCLHMMPRTFGSLFAYPFFGCHGHDSFRFIEQLKCLSSLLPIIPIRVFVFSSLASTIFRILVETPLPIQTSQISNLYLPTTFPLRINSL